MKKNAHQIDISVIAPLLTLITFSVCVLFVLLFGTRLYKESLIRDEMQFEFRTVNQYIKTKINQSDSDSMIFIGDFSKAEPQEVGDTLFLVETIGGIKYYTRIYCSNGYLYELFSTADNTFEKDDGEKILPLNGLNFKQNGNMIEFAVSQTKDHTDFMNIVLRSANVESYEK